MAVFYVQISLWLYTSRAEKVREENPPSNKFHWNFRLWLDRNPALDEAAVLEEDKTITFLKNISLKRSLRVVEVMEGQEILEDSMVGTI